MKSSHFFLSLQSILRDMKKIACFLIAVMTVLSVFAEDDGPQERKKVAVVLSGGGAKGVAHIGALKVIEKAGLPIDIITGTSMGSLVGGLYAIGYNAHSLDSIARNMDWTYVLTDREDLSRQSIEDRQRQNTYMLSRGLTFGKRASNSGGIIKGKNLDVLLQKLCMGYTDSMDFNRLPIPFACVATDIVDNSEVDFTSGHARLDGHPCRLLASSHWGTGALRWWAVQQLSCRPRT